VRRTGIAIADAVLLVALLVVAGSAALASAWTAAASAGALAVVWGVVAWLRFTVHARRLHARRTERVTAAG